MKKNLLRLLCFCLSLVMISCGSKKLSNKTIKVNNVAISGQGQDYFKVVDGDYEVKVVDDKMGDMAPVEVKVPLIVNLPLIVKSFKLAEVKVPLTVKFANDIATVGAEIVCPIWIRTFLLLPLGDDDADIQVILSLDDSQDDELLYVPVFLLL